MVPWQHRQEVLQESLADEDSDLNMKSKLESGWDASWWHGVAIHD